MKVTGVNIVPQKAQTMADYLFQQIEDGAFVLSEKGEIIYCNPAGEKITGYSMEELKTLGLSALLGEKEFTSIFKGMQDYIGLWSSKLHMVHKKQNRIPCQVKSQKYSLSPGCVNYLVTFTDTSLQSKYKEDQMLANKLFENIDEGVMITDGHRKIISVNPSFQIVTGYSEDEVIGKNPKILQSGLHNKQFYDEMWHDISINGRWSGEIWNKRKDGEIYPEWLTISSIDNDNKEDATFVAIFSDITDLKHAEDQLRKLAHYDVLTGAANRYLLNEQLGRLLVTAQKYRQMLGVLFLDLDRFKLINDTLGHNYGDLLLKKVSARLKGLLRNKDMIARLGGDEFVIVLPNIKHAKETVHVSKEIIRALQQPFLLDDKEVYTSTSIGISIFPLDGIDIDTLIKNADRAMYQAKADGRNKFEMYHSGLHQENETRQMIIENRLRKAIENKGLSLFYHPQADAKTGEITGVEALLRWKDAELGFIPPGEFIPIAEETGLIVPISEWVINQACMDIKQLHVTGYSNIRVSINISGIHFRQDNFVKSLSKAIENTNINPQLVELELTESMIMPNAPELISELVKLKQLGIKLSIDDFGTGYSSLSYLHRFPIDRLKIDQSFIKNLSVYKEDASIVKAIITMAHKLKMEVVAEGVEHRKQLEFLQDEACDTIQGFFLTQPIPLSELENFLEMWEPGYFIR